MLMQTRRYSAMLLVVALVLWSAGQAWGIGFMLGETKDELKLKYDVVVNDHGTGRVTIVLTIRDEGRLQPLDDVQLAIPAQEKNADGSSWMDLVVSLRMTETNDGERIGRVHILKELAERAEIRLNTHTMDGKPDPLTRLHHVIPIAEHLKNDASAAPTAKPAPTTTTPPAADLKKD